MEAAGIPLDRPDPVLHVTPLQREAAAARLDVTGAVALGIAASDDWKNWGSERFAALARSLDRPIVLVGGPAEQGIADAILAATPPGKIRSALGWPLRELAAMLAGCSLYIGNDTAALNMAAAVGVRSIGLFGGTAPLRHSPLIIPILPPGGIDRETGMSRITVDAVLAQIPQLPV